MSDLVLVGFAAILGAFALGMMPLSVHLANARGKAAIRRLEQLMAAAEPSPPYLTIAVDTMRMLVDDSRLVTGEYAQLAVFRGLDLSQNRGALPRQTMLVLPVGRRLRARDVVSMN